MVPPKLILVFMLFIYLGEVLMNPGCCIKQEVLGATNLDGTYWLTENVDEILLPQECRENCVYRRDGHPGKIYCFRDLPPSVPSHAHCQDNSFPSMHQAVTTPYKRNPMTAPPLEIEQTRIIMSWPDEPQDLDIHVLGFPTGSGSQESSPIGRIRRDTYRTTNPPTTRNYDQRTGYRTSNQYDYHTDGYEQRTQAPVNQMNQICRIYYSAKCDCPEACLDIDHTSGGRYGPETVTLQNSKVNAGFTYAIGIHDYRNEYSNEEGGYKFGFSQAKIEVTNGTTSFSRTLPIGSLPSSSWWFFGCISITMDNVITYYPATDKTIFNGREISGWIGMVQTYCNVTVDSSRSVAMDDPLDFPPKH